MEKVRLTLWDVFTFFLVGAYTTGCVGAILVLRWPGWLSAALPQIASGSAIVTAVGLGSSAILVGMLVEPFANYLDRYVLSRLPRQLRVDRDRLNHDDMAVRELAISRLLDPIGLAQSSPFRVLKDYVEREQLAPTVMIFLSRFGFYRSVAAVTLVSSVILAVTSDSGLKAGGLLIAGILAALVFKARSDEFYSYIAPAVYRAALFDMRADASTTSTCKPKDSDE